MKRELYYSRTHFPAEIVKEAHDALVSNLGRSNIAWNASTLLVRNGNETWEHDSLSEFLSDYRKQHTYAYVSLRGANSEFAIFLVQDWQGTKVSVTAPDRPQVEELFEVFARNAQAYRHPVPPPPPPPPPEPPSIFIGHGRSAAWRELKDHLSDIHKLKVVAYETGARAGHTIRDILEEMTAGSTFALLVMTGEDGTSEGGMRARQNVIHETGLFQGRLGWSRAVVLLENGTEDYSNLAGVQQIRFDPGNIESTFGHVLGVLRREFPPAEPR